MQDAVTTIETTPTARRSIVLAAYIEAILDWVAASHLRAIVALILILGLAGERVFKWSRQL